MKVVIGASAFGTEKALDFLREKGIEVVANPFSRRLTQEETIAHLQGAVGILAGLEPLNEAVFSACPDLKVLARIGIGMDNVDQEAAKKHGIAVSNTPDAPSDAVAEMTMAALLTIARQIIFSNQDVHQEIWKKRMGFSLKGCKIFLIGYGRIGEKTAKLMSAFGAEIRVYDKYQDKVSTCTLEEGLSWAEVISLHASGGDEILGEKELNLCTKGVVILNSARGGLIQEKALESALQSGQVGYFWCDALWEEPYHGPLLSCDTAILTPHICSYTTLCREEMEMQAALNLWEDLGKCTKKN